MITGTTHGAWKRFQRQRIKKGDDFPAFLQHQRVIYREIDPEFDVLGIGDFHDPLTDRHRLPHPVGLVCKEHQARLRRQHLDLSEPLLGILQFRLLERHFRRLQRHFRLALRIAESRLNGLGLFGPGHRQLLFRHPELIADIGIVVPEQHPLTAERELTLAALAHWPIVTYQAGLTGRARVDDAFAEAGIVPQILLTAQDSDVIKTYVELEMGVGILADMAFDSQRDKGLVQLDGSRLFAPHTAWIGLKQGQFQHNFAWQFIQLCNPELALAEIQARAMSNEPLLDYQI